VWDVDIGTVWDVNSETVWDVDSGTVWVVDSDLLRVNFRYHYTGCIKMIGAVSVCYYSYKMHAEVSFPHGTKQQVFKFCAHVQSHSPLLSRSVT